MRSRITPLTQWGVFHCNNDGTFTIAEIYGPGVDNLGDGAGRGDAARPNGDGSGFGAFFSEMNPYTSWSGNGTGTPPTILFHYWQPQRRVRRAF